MCGILGVVDFGRLQGQLPWNPDELALIDAARDGLAARGPDGFGTWHQPGIALSHRRLAIIDLSPAGRQPMISERGSALTFNGEIYNYLELRKELRALGRLFRSDSDTEVLQQALETWGLSKALTRLRGMYAFAWWQGQVLHLARDPVGKKPLYWWQHGQQLRFSSGLLPLARWLVQQGHPLTVDPVAVEHYLASGYIDAPRTIYHQINKLEAGSSLEFSTRGLLAHAALPMPIGLESRRLDLQSLDSLDQLLVRAVERRLRSDVPVATFLSGGLDSSLVTALAAQQHAGITAYTVRTPNRNADEFAIACRVAKVTGVRHEVLDLDLQSIERMPELVRHYGEPFGDSSALPTYLIAERAGQGHRVILTGDGGDEVQGGYPSAQLFAFRQILHQTLHVPTWPDALSNWADRCTEVLPNRLAALDFRAIRLMAGAGTALGVQLAGWHRLHNWFDPALRPVLQRQGWAAMLQTKVRNLAIQSEIDQALAMDFGLYLPEDLCVKVDVAAMAWGVETRSPLLDLDFTNASWRIRPQDRVGPRQTKRIIRALLARHLPADCVMQRKQGFSIPLQSWLDSPQWRQQMLEPYRQGLKALPWLDGQAVHAFLSRPRPGDDGGLLWRLWFLGQWHEQLAIPLGISA